MPRVVVRVGEEDGLEGLFVFVVVGGGFAHGGLVEVVLWLCRRSQVVGAVVGGCPSAGRPSVVWRLATGEVWRLIAFARR